MPVPRLYWDYGTAYDLFASLWVHTLPRPKDAATALRTLNQIPPMVRLTLEEADRRRYAARPESEG